MGHTGHSFKIGYLQAHKCNSRSTNVIDSCQILILDLGRIYLVNNFLKDWSFFRENVPELFEGLYSRAGVC